MKFVIPTREPGKAYRAGWLWLPKRKVNVGALQTSLELEIEGRRGMSRTLPLWRNSPNHIGVPRELIPMNEIRCDLVDVTPKFERVKFHSRVKLDLLDQSRSTQQDAYADLVRAECGILNLACGAGKTVIILHAVAKWGVPTLIINDRENILDQWRDEIRKFLRFKGEIGWIQGKPHTWTWKTPIALASLKTLAMYHDQLPQGMAQHFGVSVWDEIHHLSAPEFSKSAAITLGRRVGATATAERGDGTEMVYYSHVGPIVHSNLDQDIQPRIWFANSPIELDLNDHEVWREVSDVTNELHLGKLAAYVGTRDEELDFIQHHLNAAKAAGRNILAISVSKKQIYKLAEMNPDAGVITGDVKDPKERRRALKNQLTIGTAHLTKEALNDRDLDALFILTEFTKPGMLQQAVGRVQRMKMGKKQPQVVVIGHPHIRPLRAMGNKMRKYFRSQHFEMEEI